MRVLLAGGGTAGHINPAIAIAKEILIKHSDAQILFVGTSMGMEKKLVPAAGFAIKYIDVQGFRRKLTWQNVTTVTKLVRSLKESREIIEEFKPDIAIGTGGYVSGPVIYMAHKMGVKTLIHEQNAFAGLTSKLLSRVVDCVAISFEESRKYFRHGRKVVLTGNPLRGEILGANKGRAREKLGLDDSPMLLAFGGSLGAKPLNDALTELIMSTCSVAGAGDGAGVGTDEGTRAGDDSAGYQVIFATGERFYEEICKRLSESGAKFSCDIGWGRVRVVPYINDMASAMAAADVVVARGGAITLGEITALGKASVIVPSPYVTNNHQEYNARALEAKGACVVVIEDELARLGNEVRGLLDDELRREEIARSARDLGILDANERIMRLVDELT
ncbi:MAG: undecaprenyldiphospho-muramoylpentapeptide beta-N-acetylglucosaminyltransferase [Clostridiales bacterium]|jgi:UDP-N-acetylglucosamine--N-acetylmuramyl-(pentapeptide) pyrophosphoryl-undecaprenol N-acetylglucosamine transferase|nr:undecaprenyldiphospho-muramoylpentapeptide beta-N-acetylglucosaminyltransferase [Clostridiales bacterium]